MIQRFIHPVTSAWHKPPAQGDILVWRCRRWRVVPEVFQDRPRAGLCCPSTCGPSAGWLNGPGMAVGRVEENGE